ncbi:MAG: MCP four helix bundle domain-containing protein, partial [Deltaproteobacteria bacterium]|nr:MCP four helix bundle domain-containing protein [Deltaproteobacteria bacterium]
MKGFADLKVGGRLILGFSVMILFMAGIGFAGFRSIHQINGNLEEIFAVNLPSMDYLLETDRDLQQLLVAERSLIFSNARSEIFKKLVEEYEENLQQSDARWEKYKALAETPEEKELIAGYEKAREEWKAVSRRVVEGRAADTREGRRESLDLTLGQARERFEQMRTYLDKLTGISLDLAREDRETASETYRNTLMFLF